MLAAAGLGAALIAGTGLISCNATSSTVAGAAASTGLAAGFAALQRHGGDCYTPCVAGTTCNRASGLCERVPCGGQCLANEKCEESWSGGVRCVGADGLAVQRSAPNKGAPPAAGLIPVWKPLEGSSSAPADAKLPAEGDALPPR